jgi:hypothetical protein
MDTFCGFHASSQTPGYAARMTATHCYRILPSMLTLPLRRKEIPVRLLSACECMTLSYDHKAPPSRCIPASDLPQLGIEPVPQPVSQEVDREHREQHGQTWEERDPPGGRQKATAVGDHQAPGWIGRWDPNTQET